MSVVVHTPGFRPRDLVTFRGYRQSAVAWLEYGTATGAVYFAVGPLFAGMLPEVGWSLGVVSAALLVRGLLAMVANPFAGWLVSRIGVRPVVVAGGVFSAAFTALTGLVQTPLQFIIVFGGALVIAEVFMAYVPAATLVQSWFLVRRGAVMGFVNSGAGFGGLIFAPLVALLVAQLGWRHALFALGGIILVLTLPALTLRNGPRDVGEWVDGVEGRVIPDRGATDELGTPQRGIGEVLRSPVFWMVFAIFGLTSWAIGSYAAFQVLYLQSVGVAVAASSGALGVSAGVGAVVGLLLGRLNDRVSPYIVFIIATVAMTASSFLFLFARNEPLLWTYAILSGIGFGLTAPTLPVAIARYFGAQDFPRVFGVGMILAGLMSGVGPFVTGLLADATGSFAVPIYLITGLLVLSTILAVLARPPAFALRTVITADTPATTSVEV